jgi:hypothetical protein
MTFCAAQNVLKVFELFGEQFRKVVLESVLESGFREAVSSCK